MRISPGWMTFLAGLPFLAAAGIVYQQSLISSGALGGSGAVVSISAPALAIYTCPMHPQIEQDHPGTCPICGMELVPRVEDTATIDSATGEAIEVVKLSPLQAVLADVNVIHPSRERMALSVPAIGEVQVPEDQVNMLVSWQAGRVDNLFLRETGGRVEKGDHLLDIYSEELVLAQEEHLLALEAVRRLGQSGYESIAASSKRLLSASRKKLLRLGLTAEQIAELEVSGEVLDHIPVYASHSGIVMEKSVTEGMYVKEGGMLFTVADLSPVWVEVEIFEKDAANIKMGDSVSLKCPIHPGMTFHGTIALIEPSLDPSTRTHLARVVVDNPEMILRPGLIMEAELTFDYGEMILLPRNAVLHTGDGDLVYVLAGENLWEPRRVTIGRDFGDKVEILSGIAPDEAVAGTAVFLLDSEAQLKGMPRPVDLPAPGESP
ncbi:efflux RND transporter periplasmic adaptor subunit [bacterium]|nr:efflux RND transporter periplasmic adaptor subunit [bacterium]